MGIFDFLFGGGNTTQTTTTSGGTSTTSQELNLPPWLEEPAMDLVQRALQTSLGQYQPYGEERVMPLTGLEQQGIDILGDRIGTAPSLVEEAVGLARGATGAPTTADLNQYISPYQDIVTQDMVRELDRRRAMQRNDENALAARTGAYGGSRHGVVSAEGERSHERLIGDVLAQRGEQAFNQAQGLYNQQMGRQLTAAEQIGRRFAPSYLTTTGSEAEGLLSGGGLQRQIGQTSADVAYQDFLSQRNWPYEQTGYLADILAGVPAGQRGFSSTNQPSTTSTTTGSTSVNPLATGLGLGLGILGLFS